MAKGNYGVGYIGRDLQNLANSGIMNNKKALKVNIQLFAEKDIARQDSGSLRRAIRKYQANIEKHLDKINNPSKYDPNWDSYTQQHKDGLIRHWKKEIRNFEESILNRNEELKKRGE